MPGMDGHEVARQLRRRSDTAKVKLVAVSGYGQEADKRLSQETGFEAHLLKPVDWKNLQAVLTPLTASA